jgi:serine/threonine-protein kinase HipA
VRLVALLDGSVVGQVYQMGSGSLAFVYDDAWRTADEAYPLSLSMPLVAREHGDRAIRAYLWGLLPDNPAVLEWWARRYGVSPYSIVDLLAHVGEDCAGAVQFAIPERAQDLIGSATLEDEASLVQWLNESELESRLRELRLNPAAGRAANDTGQFSLAGAQPKTALYQSRAGQWGVPAGRMPTNRILKPPTLGLDDLAYNEHFCLVLARELGMPAAASRVQHFGDEVAIVVERYDREEIGDTLIRVHQEDLCQAFGLLPTKKYEVDGGPTVSQIYELLRESSTSADEDCERLFDAIAFNWLLAAPDAHAKNYSVLHATGQQLRLAPLYDVITILPYPQLNYDKSRLAMSVGGEHQISKIDATHWLRLARSLGLNQEYAVHRLREFAVRIPDAVEALKAQSHPDDYMSALVVRLGDAVVSHACRCGQRL